MKFANPVLPHRSTWSLDSLSRADLLAVLDGAERLKEASRAGRATAPLRGKNLALLGEARPDDELLRRAATELGVKVAKLPVAGSALNGGARLLGRLYDAVDCGRVTPATLEQLDRDAGVPVFNGLGAADHPTHVLAELLAMREHSSKPLPELRVQFVGDAQTPRAQALCRAATIAGIELHTGTSSERTDFVVDATNPQHWTLSDGDGPLDDAALAEDLRFIVQALLLNTMS